MSALLSLYLSQAVGATEEEVAGFLSPLTARSRVREILNALTAGRQLETTVVDGKTLLHVSGTLPEFAELPKPVNEDGTEVVEAEAPAKKVGTGRIARFTGSPDFKPRSDFKGKPAFGAATRERSSGPRGVRPGGPRPGGARPSRPVGSPEEVSRRPFQRSNAPAEARPTFTKPWEEEKRARPEASEGEAPRKAYGEKPAYSPKEFGEKKAFDRKGGKPSFAKDRKPYGERTYGGSNSTPRKTFEDKPAFGERKPYERKSFGDKPAYGAKKTYGEKPSFGDRKPYGERKSFGDKPAYGAKKTYGDRPSFGDRPSRPRPEGGSEGFKPRERPAYPPRDGGADRRPAFGGRSAWAAGPSRPLPEGGVNRSEVFKSDDMAPRSYERKAYAPRGGGDDRPRKTFGDKPSFGDRKPFGERKPYGSKPGGFSKPSFGGGDRKPFRPREDGAAPRSYDRPKPSFGGGDRPSRPGGFGAKPAFGSKPSYGSKPSFGGKPSFGSKPRFGAGKPAFGLKPRFGAKPFAKRTEGAAPTWRKREEE